MADLFKAPGHRSLNRKATLAQQYCREYQTWKNMWQRCSNPNATRAKRYFKAGIKVCERWEVFAYFIEDMGPAPPGYTIERKDNAGNYEPGNCVWATYVQQNNNRRNTIFVEYEGVRQPLTELCRKFGVNANLVRIRLYNRWTVKDALTKPARPYQPVRPPEGACQQISQA